MPRDRRAERQETIDALITGGRIEDIDSALTPLERALASIAISTKRIADALSGPGSVRGGAPSHTAYELLDTIADAVTGKGDSLLTAPINSYGEGIGDAIQGQIIRGQRGIDQYEGR